MKTSPGFVSGLYLLLGAGCAHHAGTGGGSPSYQASASSSGTRSATYTSSMTQSPEHALYMDMRKLWADHVIWTRDYIIAAVDGSQSADAAAKRLMKNQEDIGKAVGSFYGSQAGNQLTKLLKEHISIAVELVAAAKADDQTKFQDQNKRWKENADQIAVFLSQTNPNWPKATVADLMSMHLKTTADELNARLKKDYDKDAKAFDAVFDHILHMADVLSTGIIKQFPEKFRST